MNYTEKYFELKYKIGVWSGIILLVCLVGAFIFFTTSIIIDKIKEKRKEKGKNATKEREKSKSNKL